ncbi:MAG TPA: hypothetical protein VGE72_31330, partial [Azospirillum sp.]
MDGRGDLNGTGGTGNDAITGNGGRNLLDGGAGNDLLRGMGGNDTVRGAAGRDTVSGGDGADRLYGGTGDDTLDGGTGNDQLWYDGGGRDVMIGGGGDDLFLFDPTILGAGTHSVAIHDFQLGLDHFGARNWWSNGYSLQDQDANVVIELQDGNVSAGDTIIRVELVGVRNIDFANAIEAHGGHTIGWFDA